MAASTSPIARVEACSIPEKSDVTASTILTFQGSCGRYDVLQRWPAPRRVNGSRALADDSEPDQESGGALRVRLCRDCPSRRAQRQLKRLELCCPALEATVLRVCRTPLLGDVGMYHARGSEAADARPGRAEPPLLLSRLCRVSAGQHCSVPLDRQLLGALRFQVLGDPMTEHLLAERSWRAVSCPARPRVYGTQ